MPICTGTPAKYIIYGGVDPYGSAIFRYARAIDLNSELNASM